METVRQKRLPKEQFKFIGVAKHN